MTGDKKPDTVIAAPTLNLPGGKTQVGTVFVLHARTVPGEIDTNDLDSEGYRINGADTGDNTGQVLGLSPDIDGDGRQEVVLIQGIGGPAVTRVVYGRQSTAPIPLPTTSTTDATMGNAGYTLTGTGDIGPLAATDFNTDGQPDLAIDSSKTFGLANDGDARIVYGRPDPASLDLGTLPSAAGGRRINGAVCALLFCERAGYAMRNAADVNCDGVDDFVVGAPAASTLGRNGNGAAYVVFGTSPLSNLPTSFGSLGTKGFRIDGSAAGARLGGPTGFAGGTSVDGAGDVNGDGCDDLVLGEPGADPDGAGDATLDAGDGAAYVVFGSATPPASIDLAGLAAAGFKIVPSADEGGDAGLGGAVAGAGDTNGDGRDDVIVGAGGADDPDEGAGTDDTGAAYIVFGRSGTSEVDVGLLTPNDANPVNRGVRIEGEVNASLGESVDGVGDLGEDGDGDEDVVVSARGIGKAVVVYGGATTTVDIGSPGLGMREIAGPGVDFGRRVAGVGDVVGDGKPDLAITAPAANQTAPNGQTVFVVPGSGDTDPLDLDTDPSGAWRIDGNFGDAAGAAIDGAPDVNRDGRRDVVIGAPGPLEDIGDPPVGIAAPGHRTYVVYGKTNLHSVNLGFLGNAGLQVDQAAAGDGTGSSVAGIGDEDGDGFGDFAVGASLSNTPSAASGRVYVVRGSVSDQVGPETIITSGPADGSSVTANPVTFAFTSPEAGATFECSLDGAAFAACTSPATTPVLTLAQHTFRVRARDAAANVDPTPAQRTFTVVTSRDNPQPPPPPPPPTPPGVETPPVTDAGFPPAPVPPSPTATPDVIAPAVRGLVLARSRFAVARTPTPVSAARRRRGAPKGTTIRYTLSEPATVTIRIERLVNGRRRGRRCVPGGRRGRRCTATRLAGTLTRRSAAGANRIPFSGRIGRRALAAGRHRMTVVARDAAGNASRPASVTFVVARR